MKKVLHKMTTLEGKMSELWTMSVKMCYCLNCFIGCKKNKQTTILMKIPFKIFIIFNLLDCIFLYLTSFCWMQSYLECCLLCMNMREPQLSL